jgi:hypothetical protein
MARLKELLAAGQLTSAATLDTYAEFYPEYPGDHTGMLAEHPGQPSYLDALSAELDKN